MNIKIENKIDLSKVSKLIKDDATGEFAAKEWHRIYEDYVPYRDGELYRNVTFKPWEITHNAPYSKYIYNGKLYVDPEYGKGGFTADGSRFWSRPGVTKRETSRSLKFRKEPHSKASAKWDERAIQEKEDEKLVQAMQRYIDRRL